MTIENCSGGNGEARSSGDGLGVGAVLFINNLADVTLTNVTIHNSQATTAGNRGGVVNSAGGMNNRDGSSTPTGPSTVGQRRPNAVGEALRLREQGATDERVGSRNYKLAGDEESVTGVSATGPTGVNGGGLTYLRYKVIIVS